MVPCHFWKGRSMKSLTALSNRDSVRSLVSSFRVLQRSFVWTVVVTVTAAIGMVASGGANADSPSDEGDMNSMLAQTDGK